MRKVVFILFAIILFGSCTRTRIIFRLLPDTKDYKKFPTYTIKPASKPYHFEEKIENNSYWESLFSTPEYQFKKVFRKTKTNSFLVFHADTLVYEKYRHGYSQDKIQTVFSISKSVVALLVMNSLMNGKLESLDEPITKYIDWMPDSVYGGITLNHLLNMQSGLTLKSMKPFDLKSGPGVFYYGPDAVASLKRLLTVEYAPGVVFKYRDINVQLLLFALEKIEQRPFVKIFNETIWDKIGAENKALWIADRSDAKVPYAFSGLTCSPIDLAKIGSILLHQGYACNGEVCSKSLLDSLSNVADLNPQLFQKWLWWHSVDTKVLSDSLICDKNYGTHYFVWSEQPANDIFAEGFRGQFIYLYPAKNLMIIRTGEQHDYHNPLFRDPKKRKFKWPKYLLDGCRNYPNI